MLFLKNKSARAFLIVFLHVFFLTIVAATAQDQSAQIKSILSKYEGYRYANIYIFLVLFVILLKTITISSLILVYEYPLRILRILRIFKFYNLKNFTNNVISKSKNEAKNFFKF